VTAASAAAWFQLGSRVFAIVVWPFNFSNLLHKCCHCRISSSLPPSNGLAPCCPPAEPQAMERHRSCLARVSQRFTAAHKQHARQLSHCPCSPAPRCRRAAAAPSRHCTAE
jgi:hypothetical protein